jgi:hypothetical protein
MPGFTKVQPSSFLLLLILFIYIEKGRSKPLTDYLMHRATDPNRAQIIYLILQPARGHLPLSMSYPNVMD